MSADIRFEHILESGELNLIKLIIAGVCPHDDQPWYRGGKPGVCTLLADAMESSTPVAVRLSIAVNPSTVSVSIKSYYGRAGGTCPVRTVPSPNASTV